LLARIHSIALDTRYPLTTRTCSVFLNGPFDQLAQSSFSGSGPLFKLQRKPQPSPNEGLAAVLQGLP